MSLISNAVNVINTVGEVLYVLAERLRAQNVPQEKASKVLSDIIRALAGQQLLARLLSPKEAQGGGSCDLIPDSDIRALISRLCKCSVVRLDDGSMKKLCELASMAIKWQTMSCESLRIITDNHLSEMERMATLANDEHTRSAIAALRARLALEFTKMNSGDETELRSSILRFLQDRRTVVSVFVVDGRQNEQTGAVCYLQNGPLPPGCELPGAIRLFNTAGSRIKDERFDPGLPRYSLVDEPAVPLGCDSFAPLRLNPPQQKTAQQPREQQQQIQQQQNESSPKQPKLAQSPSKLKVKPPKEKSSKSISPRNQQSQQTTVNHQAQANVDETKKAIDDLAALAQMIPTNDQKSSKEQGFQSPQPPSDLSALVEALASIPNDTALENNNSTSNNSTPTNVLPSEDDLLDAKDALANLNQLSQLSQPIGSDEQRQSLSDLPAVPADFTIPTSENSNANDDLLALMDKAAQLHM